MVKKKVLYCTREYTDLKWSVRGEAKVGTGTGAWCKCPRGRRIVAYRRPRKANLRDGWRDGEKVRKTLRYGPWKTADGGVLPDNHL